MPWAAGGTLAARPACAAPAPCRRGGRRDRALRHAPDPEQCEPPGGNRCPRPAVPPPADALGRVLRPVPDRRPDGPGDQRSARGAHGGRPRCNVPRRYLDPRHHGRSLPAAHQPAAGRDRPASAARAAARHDDLRPGDPPPDSAHPGSLQRSDPVVHENLSGVRVVRAYRQEAGGDRPVPHDKRGVRHAQYRTGPGVRRLPSAAGPPRWPGRGGGALDRGRLGDGGHHHRRRIRRLRNLAGLSRLAADRAGMGGQPGEARRGLDGPTQRALRQPAGHPSVAVAPVARCHPPRARESALRAGLVPVPQRARAGLGAAGHQLRRAGRRLARSGGRDRQRQVHPRRADRPGLRPRPRAGSCSMASTSAQLTCATSAGRSASCPRRPSSSARRSARTSSSAPPTTAASSGSPRHRS